MHTIRLLQSAVQIFEKSTLDIRVDNRKELLNIKAGNRSYDELLEYADELILKMNNLHQFSNLPNYPDLKKAEKLLFEMRTHFYS